MGTERVRELPAVILEYRKCTVCYVVKEWLELESESEALSTIVNILDHKMKLTLSLLVI